MLSQRVVRLLLNGTDPSRILCLTYTRAAAANMANRVFGQLSAWATLPDAQLTKEIAAIERRRPDAKKLRRARQLFAEALETPGGLKIQTIHAFCESILHQFPLEANIAGHFEMLDGVMEAALIGEVRRDMITAAVAANDPELAAAFAAVLSRGGEMGLDDLLGDILAKRDPLRQFLDETPDRAETLRQEFGFAMGDTVASIAETVWPLPGFDGGVFSAFVANVQACDAAQVARLILPHAVPAFAEKDPVARLHRLAAGFLKEDGQPYGEKTFRKALIKRMPDLLERYDEATRHIQAVQDRVSQLAMIENTLSAMIVADRLIGRYQRLKSARGFLDFNDLISRTVRLLARADVGPWIHYRLDRGIDHILLDEAQDTSPDQWRVVRQLAEEFFAGLGARDDVRRTIFAVGDEKQSIYSFQGADPAGFDDSRLSFHAKADAVGATFEHVKLEWSFRSTDDVLTAVDTVFGEPARRKGVSLDGSETKHRPIRAGDPGYVEVWPSVLPTAIDDPDDWKQAVDHAKAPAVMLANRIASTIRNWLDSGDRLEGENRKVNAGDILVLVRKRDRFIHALSRSLKDKRVAVAGADRLSLRGHIAVQDMMALGRFVAMPEDDLSLAALLRSPVFGLSEEALFAIAHRRGGQSLYAALRSDAQHARITERLNKWQNEAAYKRVHDFYAAVLGRDHVRKRMVARLGADAADILDEFLGFCLAEEKTGLPGMDAFLDTLENAAPEIRREMDQGRGEVRIMTVHAAKGLEAPVVFLVDSGSAPFSPSHLPRLVPYRSKRDGWQGDGFLWRAPGAGKNSVLETIEGQLKSKAEDEYRRLLYVGLTRAGDRLIVSGYQGSRPAADNWHSMVSAALSASRHRTEHFDALSGETVIRFRTTAERRVVAETANQMALEFGPGPLPDWVEAELPPAPSLPRPLAPSGATALIEPAPDHTRSTLSPVLDPVDEPSFAIARGLAVHKLMQVLPSLPAEERRAAAGRYLDRVGIDWAPGEAQHILQRVFSVLEEPAFAAIFAPGSRAEVSVMGQVKLGATVRTIAGKIDRLAVTEDRVQIVDYKTNRPPPSRLADVPGAYVAQLALYRAVLQPLYPGHRVDAALLFSEAPRLIEIPQYVMDGALARLGGA